MGHTYLSVAATTPKVWKAHMAQSRFAALAVVTLVSILVVVLTGTSTGSVLRNTGVITGRIAGNTNAPPAPGRQGKPLALSGEVSVFRVDGRLVRRQHVRPEHHFRFLLSPGLYLVQVGRKLIRSATRPCNTSLVAKRVRVRAGATSTVAVYSGCTFPVPPR